MQIFFFAFTVVFKKREKQLKHNPKNNHTKTFVETHLQRTLLITATRGRHVISKAHLVPWVRLRCHTSYISSHLVAFLLLHYTRISLLKKGDYDQILDTVSLMARGPDELRSAGKTYWFCFITSLHEMACLVCCCPIAHVHKSQEDSNKLS